MRLVFYQYGDYAEAATRFAAGGKETYYAQKYSVDFVAKLAGQVEDLTVLSFAGDSPEIRLPSGVRCIGFQLYPKGARPRQITLFRHLERLRPTHLVITTPQPLVIAWALARGVRVLPMFADSFQVKGPKARLTFGLLARLLNSRRIPWASNHNLAASLDLVRIGVDARKVVPFDWPAFVSPKDRPVKQLRGGDEFKVFYVGQLTDPKGVGDLLEAIRQLNAGGNGASAVRYTLTIAGTNDGSMEARAQQLGIGDKVKFLGRIPHDEIVPRMNQHDAVVVPSRHEYPEGLPMTIYEALCSRTPLVVSDHPMFRLKVKETTALSFPASNPAALADRLRRLHDDATLYESLSRAGEQAAAEFFCPLKFDDLISRWLANTPADHQHLSSFAISTGRYGVTA